MKTIKTLTIAILQTTIFSFTFGQTVSVSPNTNGHKINDSAIKIHTKDERAETSATKFIVRLQIAPLNASSDVGRFAMSQRIDEEHKRFKADLALCEIVRAGSEVLSKITHEYKSTFNGFAIEASSVIIEQIKKLPYVTSVTVDRQVKSEDFISNQIIKAPEVWSEFKVTGKNINIGIIDTGVDYMHIDLGKGIGNTFKVKGGYDFVNADNDPMDDNGHGTHVAGIAAANGLNLKGVAPDASIYAYKVLDNKGFGNESSIIAAIERTVDPDQNPATSDALDVVNMSLGHWYHIENDPMVEAVENAIASGVIYVIAAGNNYQFGSVGSPGVAPNAITVGATDNEDNTAPFSSKGPTARDFHLKPDVSAPGVNIYSAFLGDSYKSFDGTSMAAPHVAGAVALLLEKHPEWRLEIIKSVLMQTSKRSIENIFAQGAGRVNILAAIQSQYAVTPAAINLGLKAANPEVIVKQIRIHNLGAAAKTFTMSIEGEIDNPALEISFSQDNVTVLPNAEAELTVTFTIKGTLERKTFPECFAGAVVATADDIVLRSLVTILNPRSFKLMFTDGPPADLLTLDIDANIGRFHFPIPQEMRILLPESHVDLIAFYYVNGKHKIVVKENLKVGDNDSIIYFSSAEATNKIAFMPKDKNGKYVKLENDVGHTSFKGKNRNCYWSVAPPIDTLFISNQHTYFLENAYAGLLPSNLDELYNIVIATPQSTTSSNAYTNDESELVEIEIINPKVATGTDQYLKVFNQIAYFTSWNTDPIRVGNPLRIYQNARLPHGNLHVSPDVYGFSNNPRYISILLSAQSDGAAERVQTPWFEAKNNETISFYDRVNEPITVPVTDKKFRYILCNGMVTLNQMTTNGGASIQLLEDYNKGTFLRYFGDRENDAVEYTLRSNGEIVEHGSFKNALLDDTAWDQISYDAQIAKYNLTLRYNYELYPGRKATATADMDFNMTFADSNPPKIRGISLAVDGMHVDMITPGQHATLNFVLTDQCVNVFACGGLASSIKSVAVQAKRNGEENWRTLPVVPSKTDPMAELYMADLGVMTDHGLYDINLIAFDEYDNTLKYTLAPAFAVGEVVETGIPETTEGSFVGFPNPINTETTLAFSLQKSEKAEISIVDMLGKEVKKIHIEHRTTGVKSVIWKADNEKGDRVSPGIYVACLKVGSATKQLKLLVSK